MKIGVYTLGCKVNQYESNEIIAFLNNSGHEASSEFACADVYVINTCSITAEADKKSRQMVARSLKNNANAKVIIVGCSSEYKPESYLNKENVIAAYGTSDKIEKIQAVLNTLKETIDNNNDNNNDISNHVVAPKALKDTIDNNNHVAELNTLKDTIDNNNVEDCFQGVAIDDGKMALREDENAKARVHLKIQDGCDNFCSYCIVPYLRGRSRSRDLGEIVKEAAIISQTTHEIVITGINITAYGRDFNGSGSKSIGLGDLVYALRDIPARKRLGSLECGCITEEFLELMRLSGFCDHFHLSLQSGSSEILRAMNRHYTPEEFYRKTMLIREVFPYAGITTDIITAFPTETERHHKETIDFMNKVGFSDIHVFPYSIREGTKAAKMVQVDSLTASKRALELAEIKKQLRLAFYQKNLNKNHQVFIEDSEGELNVGYTSNYIKVFSSAPRHSFYVHRLEQIHNINGMKGEVIIDG